MGLVSTHFAHVHEPTPIEMETVKVYGVGAADYAYKLLGDVTLATKAEQMREIIHLGPPGLRATIRKRGAYFCNAGAMKMKKIASISTNPKRTPIKARFLIGTMLSAVVWGSVHATPLDKALVVAQAPPQGEQEDKKQAPQRPGQRQKQQEERREEPKPPPGAQPPGRRQERQVQPPPSPGEQPPGRRQERQVQPPSTPGEQPPGRRQELQVQPAS